MKAPRARGDKKAAEGQNQPPGLSRIAVNVLSYKEDGQVVALALEMDLRGRGPTLEEAVADLRDLIGMQISFALFKGLPDMIWRPAEPVFFHLFAETRRTKLRAMAAVESPVAGEYEVGGLEIPPPHVIDQLKRNFSQADA